MRGFGRPVFFIDGSRGLEDVTSKDSTSNIYSTFPKT
jgi:hypothetical protein